MTAWTRRQFIATTAMAAPLAFRNGIGQDSSPITAAMASVRSAIPTAETDPERPVYHFRPPANWNNDPNGTMFYRGWHHLFYQHNPAAARGGNQHWGHARSRDLVNWEHLPIALWPLTERGERAIFSGGATLGADGRPRVFYTSIGHLQPEQWIAVPDDDELIRWSRPATNPVLTAETHGAVSVSQWRDPFLFNEGRATYMVCGGNVNNSRGGGGTVQLYKAKNAELTRWEFLGIVFRYRDLQIYNVECPNLFRLQDKWVLLMSPQQPCEYFIGDLDLNKRQFLPDAHGVLDAGTAYASNISFDDRGRCILWLWGRTNTAPEKGWNGCMVMPRILSIAADGFLRQQPAAEFEMLRQTAVTLQSTQVPFATPLVLDRLGGDCLELRADLNLAGSLEMGFDLRRSSSGKAGIQVRVSRNGVLTVGSVRAAISRSLERYRLHIFLDKRVIEVYANDGEAALFSVIDAGAADLEVAAVAQEGPPRGRFGGPGGNPLARGRAGAPSMPQIESLTAWPLRAARFDLANFRA